VIGLGVITDGRFDYLRATIASAVEHLPDIPYRYIVDDSGADDSCAYLADHYRGWQIVHHAQRRGLAGAVKTTWQFAIDLGLDYLFHLEDDFTFERDVDMAAMVATLQRSPRCAQMLLKRQPLSPEELAAGDVLGAMGELRATGWVDCVDPFHEHHWTAQRRIFSLNPCVIPRAVLDLGWPDTNEAGMTTRLLATGYEFGVWGKVGDPPAVIHIGEHRSAGWEL